MSNKKIFYSNLRNNIDAKLQYELNENKIADTNTEIKGAVNISHDLEVFLLNNILMSVQFFENYERDIEILRDKWFKEMALPNHHKKCFFADSLHKLIGSNIKFLYRHGVKKDSEEFLHPLRIFVSNDNVESAYDPSALKPNQTEITPNYQFTIKPCENNKKDKSGFVFLVELKTSMAIKSDEKKSNNSFHDIKLKHSFTEFDKSTQSSFTNLGGKSNLYLQSARRLTKTEKIIGFQNKELKFSKLEKASILKNAYTTTNEMIPNNGFYIYTDPEMRLHSKPIFDFRMNNIPQTSHCIPRKCFQYVEIKEALNTRRRSAIKKNEKGSCFSTKTVLNSAAFKGYFCDLLIERLADPLGLDSKILEEGLIHEEFLIINNNETIHYITPVVEIKDWNKFININKKGKALKIDGKLKWPTEYMQNILQNLPCNVVPNGYSQNLEENLDYEKEWKIIFPKAEEYLILHVMHAHLRCYFFMLVIYKSFIELEINRASFGPKHLLHLLFWRVQRDFTAWPEDRAGETLLSFLKILYKKLQNKVLYDFFITSRNLFENSLLKDLHKVQTIIKMIIDNPVPYIMRALRNLHLQDDFYLTFDILKLNEMLTEKTKTDSKINKKSKVSKKEKGKKTVWYVDDLERQWRKDVVRQIQIERKLEEQKQISRLSIESINTEESLQMDSFDSLRWCEITEMFINHFIQMGIKSSQYKALDQSQMYLFQAKKLINLLSDEYDKEKLIKLKDKTYILSEKCDELQKCKFTVTEKLNNKTNKTKKISQETKPSNSVQNDFLKIENISNAKTTSINHKEKSVATDIKVIQVAEEKELTNDYVTKTHQTKV